MKKTHIPTRPWYTKQCNVVKIRLNFLKKNLIRLYMRYVHYSKIYGNLKENSFNIWFGKYLSEK